MCVIKAIIYSIFGIACLCYTVSKMGEDVVVPAEPIFYKCYVDGTYIRREKIVNDELFQNLNSYHKNIKITLQKNPRKFLYTGIIKKNNTISSQVFTKLTKSQLIINVTLSPVSYIPVDTRRRFNVDTTSYYVARRRINVVTTSCVYRDRAKKIATDFDKELRRIKRKFLHAGYPVKFINDTFFRFNEEKKELLIPKWFFDEMKSVAITLPFAPRDEKFSKLFISKLQTFTNGKVRFNIIWNSHKIQSFFNKKDKVQHLSCGLGLSLKIFLLKHGRIIEEDQQLNSLETSLIWQLCSFC